MGAWSYGLPKPAQELTRCFAAKVTASKKQLTITINYSAKHLSSIPTRGRSVTDFIDEFLQGQTDCKNGVPHEDKGDHYNRGYAAQYQEDQNMNQRDLDNEQR